MTINPVVQTIRPLDRVRLSEGSYTVEQRLVVLDETGNVVAVSPNQNNKFVMVLDDAAGVPVASAHYAFLSAKADDHP